MMPVIKGKVYLKPGEQPPKGASVHRGPHGGEYYEDGQGPNPKNPSQAEQQHHARFERIGGEFDSYEQATAHIRGKEGSFSISMIPNSDGKYKIQREREAPKQQEQAKPGQAKPNNDMAAAASTWDRKLNDRQRMEVIRETSLTNADMTKPFHELSEGKQKEILNSLSGGNKPSNDVQLINALEGNGKVASGTRDKYEKMNSDERRNFLNSLEGNGIVPRGTRDKYSNSNEGAAEKACSDDKPSQEKTTGSEESMPEKTMKGDIKDVAMQKMAAGEPLTKEEHSVVSTLLKQVAPPEEEKPVPKETPEEPKEKDPKDKPEEVKESAVKAEPDPDKPKKDESEMDELKSIIKGLSEKVEKLAKGDDNKPKLQKVETARPVMKSSDELSGLPLDMVYGKVQKSFQELTREMIN